MRLVSWNVNKLALWDEMRALDVDVALLQEVVPPAADCPVEVIPGAGEEWVTAGWEKRPWRTAVARLSDRIRLEPIAAGDIGAEIGSLRVSRPGTITAVRVYVDEEPQFIAVSVYVSWDRPIGRDTPAWADASAHRILSDLTPLLHYQRQEPVIVAGDWNIMYGYGEDGSEYWKRRYMGVFDRAAALELRLVGPQHPYGRLADPWPDELPPDSKCVPTYRSRSQTPATASRQIDFVFASESIADRVTARALNEPEQWGPSDHCAIVVDVRLTGSSSRRAPATPRAGGR